VTAEQQRRPFRAALEHADDVGSAWRDDVDGHVEAAAPHFGGDGVRDVVFARRARHERRVHRVDGDQITEEADGWIHGLQFTAISYQLSAES
jgi:hypothetical protein